MDTTSTAQTVMKWQDTIIAFLIQYGMKIVAAMIILIIGMVIAKVVGKWFEGMLGKHQLEPPIRQLFVRIVRLLIMGLVLVIVLDVVGVPTAPFIAGIGVAGVGVGLATQGVLSNLMAGLTIIFTRPFRVGEYIELLGVNGQVSSVELFSTKLIHADRSRITIPNRKIIGEVMHNYGTTRQLHLSVGITYNADLSLVLQTARAILDNNPRVLKDPAAVIGIEALGDSTITVTLRPWVSVPDYAMAQLELYQSVVEKFRAASIDIPFPQREIRLLNQPVLTPT